MKMNLWAVVVVSAVLATLGHYLDLSDELTSYGVLCIAIIISDGYVK